MIPDYCPCEPDTWTWPDAYNIPPEEPLMLPFRPRGHWVVVQRDKEETTTRGGLAIPERHRVKMSRGKVLAIGDGCYENGQWITVNNLCIGDTVQWSSAGDTDITVQGEVYTFVPAASIVLVETTGLS